MEGRPWVRVALLLIGFSLLGIPVWSMTRERKTSSMNAPSVVAAPAQQLHVTVSFAEPPSSFRLKYHDEILCEGSASDREFSCDWDIVVPPEGVDLLLKAEWPSQSPKTAVRVEITRDDSVLVDQTFWAHTRLVQSVTVSGRSPE